MNKIISKSKYTIPTVPDIIKRKRLFDILKRYCGKRAVFITGQAAQGKSTLVASYVKEADEKTVWIHLDEDDSDHNNFFNLFIRALCDTINQKIPSNASLALGPRKNILRQREVIRHLLNEINENINIVFDNAESLDRESASFDLMDEIIRSSSSANLFIISRQMPPLDIQEYKIRQEIAVIRNRELSFARDEIKEFFSKLLDFKIDEKSSETIHRLTEGWAGGLVLLSETIKDSGTIDESKLYLKKGASNLLTRESYDFFSHGIFQKQEKKIRDFLSLASIFDIIDPDILDRLRDRDNSLKILETIEKRNLFIHSIGNGFEKKYRLNSLFREFLKTYFHRNSDRKEREGILSEAGKAYEEMDRYEDAMRFYIEGRDHFKTCDMIIKTGTNFIITGRDDELAGKIKTLPSSYLEKETWIFFYLALTKRIKGGHKNLRKLNESFERFTKEDKLRGRIISCSYLIESSVFLGTPPEELMKLLKEARAILDILTGSELFTWGRALLWQQIGFAFIAGGLDFQKGLSACKNSYILAGKIEDSSLLASSLIVSAMGYAFTGEIEKSLESLKEIDLLGESISPEYRTLRNIVDISNSLTENDGEKTFNLLEQCRGNIEDHGLLFLYPIFVELSGHFEISKKRFDEALKTASHLSDIAVLSGNSYYKGLALKLSALSFYHVGNYDDAFRKAEEAAELLSGRELENYHGGCAKLIAYLSELNLKKEKIPYQIPEMLLSSFHELRQFERSDTLKAFTIHTFIKGDFERCKETLKKAISYSGPAKRSFLSVKDTLKFLHIAITFDSSNTELKKEIDLNEKSEIVSALKWVDRHKSDISIEKPELPRVSVITLGEFKVKVGNREVEVNEWSGKKPLELFKNILAKDCFNIPKDLIIDSLWPDSDYKSGNKNLKVNLHRLRKVFDKEGNSGSSYIILKQNNISLSKELFDIDFMVVENALVGEKNIKGIAFAEKLCKGDFLKDSLYDDTITKKREKLRNIHFKLLEHLALYYEDENDYEKMKYYNSRIMSFDPLNEEACRRLMIIHQKKGNINSAVKVYKKLKENLENEIDMSPEDSTEKLYEEILNKTA